jgi:hypothetical protein
MLEIIRNHPDHFLFVVLLISRIGDILTTYVVTPTLKLEANPIMRKFRWPFAIVSLLAAFIAYWDINLSIMLAVPFLLVCASNASKMWIAKVLGEDEYFKLFTSVIQRSSVSLAIICFLSPALFFVLLGILLLNFVHELPGQYAAFGFILFAFITSLMSITFYLKLRHAVVGAS